MKTVSIIFGIIVVALLGINTYNTSTGKLLPAHHPRWMSCDGELAQALFYSTVLKNSDGLDKLADQVKQANTIQQITQLVTNGTNIAAVHTQWFQSVSQPGKCQAQIFLKKPNSDGNNTAYLSFALQGYSNTKQSALSIYFGSNVLESIHVDTMGIHWFKEETPSTIRITGALPSEITENHAVAILEKSLRQRSTPGVNCLEFVASKTLPKGTKLSVWQFAAHEVHNKRCGGDPSVSPVRNWYTVHANGEISIYDAATDKTKPLD